MTWLRIDTVAPRSDVVGHLAEALEVDLMHAFGLYVACLLGFGEHQPLGDLRTVPDRSLEQWAGWSGPPGRFAAAFRARCTADGSRQDPSGTVRGWWRQRALLDKQAADRAKRKGGVGREPPRNPRETPTGSRGHEYEYDNGNVTKELPVVCDARASANDIGYLIRCVVAMNSGLAANPAVGPTRREVSTSEQQGRVSWEADGIPVEIAEQVVLEASRTYQPNGRNRQPHSLRYFDAAVRRAWELKQHPRAMAGTSASTFVPLPEVS